MTRAPFKETESKRPDFDAQAGFQYTKSPNPNWKLGQGANSDEWKLHKKLLIDPHGDGRSLVDNYKTFISGILPRPVGFVSTIGENGVKNLAPFSYFQVVNNDPPIFAVGFSTVDGVFKDTAQNLFDTQELTINIISEWFVEAANVTSTFAPSHVDEWELSGLTPAASSVVKPPHVAESAFSVEAKVLHHHEWNSSKDPSKVTGTLFLVEGVRIHVREDVINEDKNTIDIDKLKPVSRLGGITYGRTITGYEIPRPDYLSLDDLR